MDENARGEEARMRAKVQKWGYLPPCVYRLDRQSATWQQKLLLAHLLGYQKEWEREGKACGLSERAIAKTMCIDQGNLSKQLTRLADRGFVVAGETGRRVCLPAICDHLWKTQGVKSYAHWDEGLESGESREDRAMRDLKLPREMPVGHVSRFISALPGASPKEKAMLSIIWGIDASKGAYAWSHRQASRQLMGAMSEDEVHRLVSKLHKTGYIKQVGKASQGAWKYRVDVLACFRAIAADGADEEKKGYAIWKSAVGGPSPAKTADELSPFDEFPDLEPIIDDDLPF